MIKEPQNPFELTQEVYNRYFLGFKNKCIRIYFYLRQGLELLNDFKYLVAGILAFYYVLKIDSLLLMGAMFVVSIPILIIVGYVWVHHAKKSIDWFGVEFTTHFSKYSVQLQENQLETLKELLEELKRIKQIP